MEERKDCAMTTSATHGPLANLSGTILLVGAGKMGSAMLEGWLALGLEPSNIAVIEPQPSARDRRVGGARPAPQSARGRAWRRRRRGGRGQAASGARGHAGARAVRARRDGGGVHHGGRTLAVPRRRVAARRAHSRHAEHAGCDRPRHHRRGCERAGLGAAARAGARAALGSRRGANGWRTKR